MKKSLVLVLLLPVLACGGGGTGDPSDPADPGGGDDPAVLPLRLAVPLHLPDQLLLPDLLGPLPEVVAGFEADTGRSVRLEYLDGSDYERAVRQALEGESPPDVAWIPATLVDPVAREGKLLPLEAWVAEHPYVLAGVQDWMEELYWREGHLLAVPVGEKGTQCSLGYAITTAAADRRHEPLAFQLVARLRELLPLRGLPDLVLDEIELSTEESTGGDVIQEETFYNALVRNLGDAPAEDVRVLVEIDGVGAVEEVVIPWIESGAYEILRVALGEHEAGHYRIHAVVDSAGTVPELNEANNADLIDWYYKYSGPGGSPTVVKALSAPAVIDLKAYQTNVTGMHPKVAFDGTNYLVVWAKQVVLNQTSYGHQLRAIRISPAGTILDSTPLVVASKVTKYNNFDVRFGSTNYLVAWEEDHLGQSISDPLTKIEAARVSTWGGVLDTTPITLENGAHSERTFEHEWPRIHFDGTNFVVIYRTAITTAGDCSDKGVTCGIYAKRVSPAGSVLAGKTTMHALTKSFESHGTMDTTYHAGAGLIVVRGWESALNTTGLYGIWFTSSGGAPVPSSSARVAIDSISSVYSPYDWPCASSHGTNKYVAVWSRNLTSPPKTVKYQTGVATVGSPGSAASSKGLIPTSKGDAYPAVAYDGAAYTIVTQHQVGCLAYIGAIRMAPSGTYGPATYFTSSDLVGDVDIAFGTTNGLVVFTDFNKPTTNNGPDWSWGVHFRLIDRSN